MPIWVAVAFYRRLDDQAQTIEGPEIPPILRLDSQRPNFSWDAWLGATKEEATRKALQGRADYGMPGRVAYKIITGQITEVLQEVEQPEPLPPQEVQHTWRTLRAAGNPPAVEIVEFPPPRRHLAWEVLPGDDFPDDEVR